jgi:predicted lactoylglutathione lyase
VEISQAQETIRTETQAKKEKVDEMVKKGDAAGMSAYFNRGMRPGDKD